MVVPVTIGSIVGPYRLVELLGEGGMGAVYRAEHTLLSKRTVALKMLHAFLTNHQEITQRFLNEALAASILESEHIVKVVDCQQDPRIGAWWIAMEHLRGQTLARYLASQGQALSLPTATRILSQVAEALDEAHAHGIVHRDIKPENIFLVERADTREFVKVLDFGIAKLRRDDAGVVTRTGASLGTTPYMAPEQIRGWPVDHRVDVFALAVVLYRALSNGKHPFQFGETIDQFYQLTPTELCIRQLNHNPVDIRHWSSGIPEPVAKVLERGLHRQREMRQNSAGDLIVELAGAAGTLDVVEQHSKLLAPNAARRSIQVPVQEAPLHTPPPERATVRLGPAVPPLPSTAPEPAVAASPNTTLRSAASESAPSVSNRAKGVRVLGIVVASLALVALSGIAVWFATTRAKNEPASHEVAASGATDAQLPPVTAPTATDAATVGSTASANVAIGAPTVVAAVPPVDAGAEARPDPDAAVVVRSPRDPGGSGSTKQANTPQTTLQPAPQPKPKGYGTLSLSAKPWADIVVDGNDWGSTPKDIALTEGVHTVSLSGPDGAKQTRRITIKRDRVTPLEIRWPSTSTSAPSSSP